MDEMLYGGALGVVAGLAMNRIAVFQVKRRTEESVKREAIDNIVLAVIWALIHYRFFQRKLALPRFSHHRLQQRGDVCARQRVVRSRQGRVRR